ncbi:PEP-utilizing enzyme [Krasilnikovia sp. MM14-A1259]
MLPSVRFTVGQWRADPAATVDRILARAWADGPLVVRSSALAEDTLQASQAGRFHSALGVRGAERLRAAVEAVIDSYDGPCADDQVMVQPQLAEPLASGVACSCDPSSGAPYRVLSWVDGAATDTVTGGRGEGVRTWYGVTGRHPRPPLAHLDGILDLITEVVELTGHDRVEVEFAVTAAGEAVLFQARPLVVQRSEVPVPVHRRLLSTVAERWRERERTPGVLGSRQLYGVMPDWNPAEIIGLRPRALARSLYRALITDRTWARARARYGYRDLGGTPLMVDFAGMPYIDVRASFTSFVPAVLSDGLAARLVDHYLDVLADRPHLHDKTEFDIVLSCNTFDLRSRVRDLAGQGFTASERSRIHRGLVDLTNRLVRPDGVWRHDMRRLRRLPTTRTADVGDALRNCVEYGALPFAGLARAGFVGMQLLSGLTAAGVLSEADRAALLNGLGTVAGDIVKDFRTLNRAAFLDRYGHLRPGTYDILSRRYDEQPDRYFDWAALAAGPAEPDGFRPTAAQRRDIAVLLGDAGFRCGPDEMLAFIRDAIRERERAKFEFTRVLSDVLVTAGRIGERHGLDVEDMSHVDVSVLTALRGDHAADAATLAAAAAAGRAEHAGTRSVLLPPLLRTPDDAWGFELPDLVPNFVTQLRVQAPVADIERGDPPAGAIALVSSADPGYDWLFARGIRGLVTAYGGTNSHMAIRAQELGVPAVTGVGEQRFAQYRRAARLDVDCANRLVRVLS